MKKLLVGILLLIVASSANGVVSCLKVPGGYYCRDTRSGQSWDQLRTPGGFVIIPKSDGHPTFSENLNGWNPRPYGMPPFQQIFLDEEIALVVSYIRNAWGNRGSLVTAFDVDRSRSGEH